MVLFKFGYVETVKLYTVKSNQNHKNMQQISIKKKLFEIKKNVYSLLFIL